jgi:hypothetical protein
MRKDRGTSTARRTAAKAGRRSRLSPR